MNELILVGRKFERSANYARLRMDWTSLIGSQETPKWLVICDSVKRPSPQVLGEVLHSVNKRETLLIWLTAVLLSGRQTS